MFLLCNVFCIGTGDPDKGIPPHYLCRAGVGVQWVSISLCGEYVVSRSKTLLLSNSETRITPPKVLLLSLTDNNSFSISQ